MQNQSQVVSEASRDSTSISTASGSATGGTVVTLRQIPTRFALVVMKKGMIPKVVRQTCSVCTVIKPPTSLLAVPGSSKGNQ
jgi:hypothetical protein